MNLIPWIPKELRDHPQARKVLGVLAPEGAKVDDRLYLDLYRTKILQLVEKEAKPGGNLGPVLETFLPRLYHHWKAEKRDEPVVVSDGEVIQDIVKYSKDYNCDLIIMGIKEGFLSHNAIGGITKGVIRKSKIPVMVVPPVIEEEAE